jgi:hypothetical protein
MLLNGFRVALRYPGAVVWTYIFSLGTALLFSLRLHAQLASLLDHSMAAQSMSWGFDLGTAAAVFQRLGYRVPSAGATPYLGLPVFFLMYFVLVPGALFCYRVAAPGRLAMLVSSGLCFFWRFVRITLLTVLVSLLILGPLFWAQNAWSSHVDEHVVGVAAYWHTLPGWIVILLVGSVLRLYFDLVEVYTVQLDDQYRANGKPDHRVRKTLMPAAKTLWRNLPRALGSFVLLELAGVFAVSFTGRIAIDMLAQPRVWPAFVMVQMGIFVSLLTRFWQRGAETVLAADYLLPGAVALNAPGGMQPNCSSFVYANVRPFRAESGPVVVSRREEVLDALPDPEPAAPFERTGAETSGLEPEEPA